MPRSTPTIPDLTGATLARQPKSAIRYQGRLVSDRASANECIRVAAERLAKLLAAQDRLAADTAGNANRLNDFVHDVQSALHSAERLLAQRGEAA